MQKTHSLDLGSNHVFNSLAISPDDKYLLYSVGKLFAGDPVSSDLKTTIGLISAQTLLNVTEPYVIYF